MRGGGRAIRTSAGKLPTSRTGRGYHVFFLCDLSDVEEVSRSGRRIVLFGDGELRADGLANLPPSWHGSGRQYEWLIEPFEHVPFIPDLREAGLAVPWVSREEPPHPPAAGTPDRIYLTQENTGELMEDTRDQRRIQREETTHPNLVQRLDPNLAWKPDNNLKNWLEEAILATQPTGPGQRHFRLFDFTRILQTHPESEDWDEESLMQLARRWFDRALPVIGTKDWLVTQEDFLDGWERVRVPLGEELMSKIVQAADRNGCPPEVAADCEGQPSGRAAGICRELWRRGSGEFFLDVRTLGESIGQSHETAATILRGLARRKLIEVRTGGTRGRATEYRYLGQW